nr:MAG TPA: hypothetical protein [Caudoviricetes sp.]
MNCSPLRQPEDKHLASQHYRTWRKPKDLKAVFSGCALKNSGENLGRRANPAMQDLKYLTDQ